MVSKPKTSAKGKSTGKKPSRPRAKPRASARTAGAEKLQGGVPAPVADKPPNQAVSIGERTPPSPTAPAEDTQAGDEPSESKTPEEKQRFRVGRPSNPYLVLHPPPRLGRRR